MDASRQEELFRSWIKEYRNLLFKVVNAYAIDSDDKEDLFQEISIQVWHSARRFKGNSAASTWLYRVALNTAMTWSTKEKKHRSERLESVLVIPHEFPPEADERLAWLHEEVQKLGDIDKPLCLLLLEGYSYKEMAGILGMSESNIGVRIHRIKKHLTQRASKLFHHEH